MPRPVPARFAHLRLPVIAAPMFLVSGPDLVIATCRAGIAGSFPALNARTTEGFVAWMDQITAALGDCPVPYGVNLIVHKSNSRLDADLDAVIAHQVPFVITSLGAVPDLVKRVQAYGGLVLHDVINLRHAEKALEAGVDGVIAVCGGAGGHAGTYNPFAFAAELRPLVGDRLLILAGSIVTGEAVAGAIAAGADLAYMGTRFIATQESMAPQDYKTMICAAGAKDIVYTPKFSGVNANFLAQSIRAAGLDLDTLEAPAGMGIEHEAKAWKNIWSAGHGVGGIHDIPSVAALVDGLEAGFARAHARLTGWR